MNNKHISIHNSVFKIGIVYSVDGREVKVRVDHNKNSSHLIYKGTLIKNVSVGGYVKILKGYMPIIGKVESEFIYENKQDDKQLLVAENSISRILVVKLIGFIDNQKFCRGVNELPLIDNECHLLTSKEFNLIHTFANDGDVTIPIGHLANDSLVSVKLGVNKLFSSHIGIFGNTGSGKSYTLAKIYRELFVTYRNNEQFKKNSKFIFIDFNGEYSGKDAIVSDKTIYDLSTRVPKNRIPLCSDVLLDLDTLCIFANATEKTQRPFISRCIEYAKYINDIEHFRNLFRQAVRAILCMADKPKAELLIDYATQILPTKYDDETHEEIGLHKDFAFHDTNRYYYKLGYDTPYAGNFFEHGELISSTLIYQQIAAYEFPDNFIEKFIHIMYLRLIRDLLDNRAMNEHIAPAINKLRSIIKDIGKLINFVDAPDFWQNHNFAVINLNDVNQDSKKMIPLLICHHLYKEHKTMKENNLSYLNIVIDEAHNILSYQSNRESDTWKDYRLEVFEEIIKEGRKFGVFMTIASQRPSDISSTIISQLHNYLIHRLVNEKDIEQVNNTISYLDKVSIESLPILSTGVCVVAGQLAEMPLVVQIDKIEHEFRPHNETVDIEALWKNNTTN
ncbi:ATP-binding protein [Parabacteroides johnsonii]|uniref:ATP-binding protein n=1 Tax=Parabacteroides johnsonii TaxID=387661 RepID=UPI003AB7E88B